MNQKTTTILTVMLSAILTVSVVAMALPWESAEASRSARGGDAEGGDGGDARSAARGGDAETGDSETNDNDNNEGSIENVGNLAEGGAGTSGTATGGAGGEATGGAGGDASGDEVAEEE